MKSFRLLSLSLLVFLLISMTADNPVKVIFFGDSITQAAVKPNGYIVKMGETLDKQGLKDKFQLVGAGIGGNKIYDLYLRLEADVLSQKPNLVFIYIGVNDVWHKRTSGTGTDPDKFEKFYAAIIKKFQDNGIKIVICTPAAIGEKTDYTNELDGDLNRYAQIIRNIASKNNLPLCDLRKAFLEYNLKNNPENKESGILTTDRVHLNDLGNQLVADEMMKFLK